MNWRELTILRPMSLVMQLNVDPGRPSEDARLLNLAMKAILVVAIISIIGAMVIFTYHVVPVYDVIINGYVNVQFDKPERVSDRHWEVWVAGVSDARDLEIFKVILLRNGTKIDEMDPLREEVTPHMTFIDLDGSGKLTTGDFFLITCDPGSSYKLSIVKKSNGNVVGSVTWDA